MKAFLLVAGTGSRLAPHTKDHPKGLLKLGPRRLIDYSLENFKKLNVADVTLITGYLSKSYETLGYKTRKNPTFATTNMVTTLFCAQDLMDDDFMISYGDIIYETSVLEKLMLSDGDVCVVVDDGFLPYWRLRFADPLQDAETLLISDDGLIREIGAKPSKLERIQSQYIGLIKVKKRAVASFRNLYEKLSQKDSREVILRGRNFPNLYMTDYLQLLINCGVAVEAVRIDHGWLEIDSVHDFDLALKMYESGTLKQFCDLDGI